MGLWAEILKPAEIRPPEARTANPVPKQPRPLEIQE